MKDASYYYRKPKNYFGKCPNYYMGRLSTDALSKFCMGQVVRDILGFALKKFLIFLRLVYKFWGKSFALHMRLLKFNCQWHDSPDFKESQDATFQKFIHPKRKFVVEICRRICRKIVRFLIHVRKKFYFWGRKLFWETRFSQIRKRWQLCCEVHIKWQKFRRHAFEPKVVF